MSRMYKVYPNVILGIDVKIGRYAIIGHPALGGKRGRGSPTRIGNNAMIRSHSVIYAGARIGEKFQSGHGAIVRENTRIGDDVVVGSRSEIGMECIIGNGVRIHTAVFIPEYTVIEDGVFLGPNCVLTNDPHPRSKTCLKGPTIRRGARIGANATVLPWLEIGEESLVGAGAVVTRDVPPNSVVVGNPARIVKKVQDYLCRRCGRKPYAGG